MIERVMKGLECCAACTNEDPFQRCDECPYNESISVQECRAVLSQEALHLIKKLCWEADHGRTV